MFPAASMPPIFLGTLTNLNQNSGEGGDPERPALRLSDARENRRSGGRGHWPDRMGRQRQRHLGRLVGELRTGTVAARTRLRCAGDAGVHQVLTHVEAVPKGLGLYRDRDGAVREDSEPTEEKLGGRMIY